MDRFAPEPILHGVVIDEEKDFRAVYLQQASVNLAQCNKKGHDRHG